MDKLFCSGDRLTWKEFKEFCVNKRYQIVIVSFFLILAYGLKLYNITISHDTEAIINVPGSLYESWYGMGRFGLVWLKKILGTFTFNPWIASFMMLVMMFLVSVIWSYVFYAFGDETFRKGNWNWIFPVLFLTSPMMMEQVNFLLQIYEICFLICVLGLVLLLTYKAILQKKRLLYIPAILGMAFCFSCYQAFVTLFVSAGAAVFLLIYEETGMKEGRMSRIINYWIVLLKLVGSFLLGFIGYEIGNKIVIKLMNIEATDYLEEMIYWKDHPIRECITNILNHIWQSFTGDGVFYSRIYGIVSIAFIVYLFYGISKRYCQYYLYILAGMFFTFSPFLMTVLLGNAPEARVQLNNPFVMAFLVQFMVNKLSVKSGFLLKKVNGILVLAVFCIALNQSMLVADLCYTEYVQYQEDVQLAAKISDRVEQLGLGENPSQPIVFFGSRSARLNKSSIRNVGLMGCSFFELSFYTAHGTYVMNNFMGTLGYIYQAASTEQVEEAERLAASMPSWPSRESVQMMNGIIIVKLS